MRQSAAVPDSLARFAPYAEYLEELDILMVYLRESGIARLCKGGTVWTNVGLGADGNVVEVEFLNAASLGVDLSNLPEWERMERLIREARLDLAIRIPAGVRERGSGERTPW